jgi:hypothetical protein
MKKITQVILTAVGIGAIVNGWRQLQSEKPKPTEERDVTRIDYLSGDYQRELEERESELQRSQARGKWSVAAGAALLAGGVTLLLETVIDETSESRPSNEPEKNGSRETSTPTRNGDPVPGRS